MDGQVERLYKQGFSSLEIAKTMSISPFTVRTKLKQLGLIPNKWKKTTREFSDEVQDLTDFEYQVLSEYVNAHTKVEMIHNSCGNIFTITPNNFLKGRGCAFCAGVTRKTLRNFKSQVQKLTEKEYTVLGEYLNSHTKIAFRHNKCQMEYVATPRSFLDGKRCPYCASNARKTTERFIKEVELLTNGHFQLIGYYVNNFSPIIFKHIECGTTFEKKPKDFLKSPRCPKCSASKWEKEIIKSLDQFKLKYKINTKLEECRDIRPLTFDFAVYHSNSLLCLIDFKGIHHYESVSPFNLSDVKRKEAIKRKYCLNNRIPYLTLPYWDIDYVEKWMAHEIDILLNY
ncbi:hypothetical protein [Bacillus sp. JJ1566]|uniref:hypothetical protein n=1 Tax=Bacillus sp. JJ1566 TaxID=3122961 RepID=UPI0030000976